MSPEEYVHKSEFDRVVADHERRLKGHDGLYRDLQETREELVRFTEALKGARDQIVSGLTDRDKCREDCEQHREGFDRRLTVLERFRWQIGGALIILSVVVPVMVKFL
jgi:DNA repair ATPase RecN